MDEGSRRFLKEMVFSARWNTGRCNPAATIMTGQMRLWRYARKKASVWMKWRTRITPDSMVILKNMVELTCDAHGNRRQCMGFMNQINVCEMEPVCEITPGTVHSMRLRLE